MKLRSSRSVSTGALSSLDTCVLHITMLRNIGQASWYLRAALNDDSLLTRDHFPVQCDPPYDLLLKEYAVIRPALWRKDCLMLVRGC